MTTQYTPVLKLALPVTGELSGTWGDVVNNNITSMVEQAIAGLSTINTWTANSHTLTTANGTTSEARCAMLVADDDGAGNPSAAATIICPAAAKLYVLKNISGQTVTLKTASGSGVAVSNNDTAFLFCDGTNVEACVTSIVNGHISGNLTVDGNTTLGDATGDTVTINAGTTTLVQGTANTVLYLNASKVISGTAGFTWNGTTLAVPGAVSATGTISNAVAGSAYLTAENTSTSTKVTIGATGGSGNAIYSQTSAGAASPLNVIIGASTVATVTSTGFDVTGNSTISGTGYLALQRPLIPVGQNGTTTLSFRWYSTGTTYTTGSQIQSTTEAAWTASSAPARLEFLTTPSGSTTPVERMRLDSSGNLGLGVTPSAWATVKAVQVSNASLYGNGGSDSGVLQNAYYNAGFKYMASGFGATHAQSDNGSHKWYTAASGTAGAAITFTQAMTLDASGNLGLGVTPSAWSGYKVIDIGAYGSIANTSSTTDVGNNVYNDGAWKYKNTNFASLYRQSGGANIWYTAASGTAGAAITFTQAMTLDASGNLLVGTSASSALAQKYIDINATNNCGINFKAGDVGQGYIYADDTADEFRITATGASNVNKLTFYAGGSERMRLDTVGNLGLGVTPSAWSGYKAVDVNTVGALVSSASATGVSNNAYYNGTAWTYKTTNTAALYLQNAATHAWYYAASGTAGNPVTLSTGMLLDASGNLGVGVTPSAWSTGKAIEVGTVGTGLFATPQIPYITSNAYYNGGWKYGISSQASTYAQSAGGHYWNVAGAGTAGAAISFTQAMTLDASGNLALGTTSAFTRLEIVGGWQSSIIKSVINVTDSQGFATGVGAGIGFAGRYATAGTTAHFALVGGRKENATDGNYAGYLAFETRANGSSLAEVGRFDSAGNFGIGVTPSAWIGAKALEFAGGNYFGSNTGNLLHCGNNNYYNGTNYIYTATAGATRYAQQLGSHYWQTAASGTAGTAITFTTTMQLDISGNLGLGVTPSAWTSNSKAIQLGNLASIYNDAFTAATVVGFNHYHDTDSTEKYLVTGVTATKYFQGGGAHKWYTAASGTAGTAITFTQSLAVGKGTSLTLEGANSAAGTGIAFPPTQLASTDANTLDDYEEGTWTPIVAGTTTAGAGTYTAQTGTYTKIGRQVTVICNVIWTAHTGTGNLSVTGLPYTSASGIESGGVMYDIVGLTLTAGSIPTVYVNGSSTVVGVLNLPTGGTTTAAVAMDVAASLYFAITYFV